MTRTLALVPDLSSHRMLIRGTFTCVLLALLFATPVLAEPSAQPGDGTAADEAEDLPEGATVLRNIRHPHLAPDGSQIAFTQGGHIWQTEGSGGEARRLTRHEADDTTPLYSPDSQTLAFASNRDGAYNVYLIPARGGAPRQLTFTSSTDYPMAWMPDGEALIIMSTRSLSIELWRLPINGGTPTRLTGFGAYHGHVCSDGERLVYSMSRGIADPWQRRYQGSAAYDVYIQPLAEGKQAIPTRLTESRYNVFNPHITACGEYVLYRAEADGQFNLYRQALPAATAEGEGNGDGEEEDAPAPEQLTFFETHDGIESMRYTPEQDAVAFAREFELYLLPMATAEIAESEEDEHAFEPERLVVYALEDDTQESMRRRIVDKGLQQADANDERIVFSLEGDIWSMPVNGGRAERLFGSEHLDQWPRLGPDGVRIAYFRQSGDTSNIFVHDLRTNESTQITDSQEGDFYHDFSPEGDAIVFASDRGGQRDIFLVELEDPTQVTQLTDSPGSDDDPTFTPCGEYIVFDSARSQGQQGIWIMERDGSNPRELFNSARYEQVPRISPDGRFVVFESIDMNTQGQLPEIRFGSLDGGATMSLGQGRLPLFSGDGRYVMFESEGELMRVETPERVVTPERVPMLAQIERPLSEHYRNLFLEAWSALRAGFYDEQMHGVDWDSVRERYLPLVEQCRTDAEFSILMNRALGELGASHMGYMRPRPNPNPDSQLRYLGGELRLVHTPRGFAMRVKETLRNGPLDQAWVRPGDHIFAVNGTRLRPDVNFFRLLTGERDVTLLVSTGEEWDRARRVEVELASAQQRQALEQHEWERRNMRLVASQSRNRVGYVHLSGMNPQNLSKITRWIQTVGNRHDALVLDVRNNGGGNIHNQLMDIFTRETRGVMHPRGGRQVPTPQVTWNKPVIVLVNERSFSDAEVFPHMFQQAGRGLVVGTETPGGVIGTRNIQLRDGSQLRIPMVGFFSVDGHNLEGHGVQPDVVVVKTLEDVANDRDPQLERAVQLVLAELEEEAAEDEEAEADDAEARPDDENDAEENDEADDAARPDEDEDTEEDDAEEGNGTPEAENGNGENGNGESDEREEDAGDDSDEEEDEPQEESNGDEPQGDDDE